MATNNANNEPTAASGKVLQGQGVGVTSAFSTATYPATTTVSQILYSSSANVVGGITTANNSVVLTNGSGIPSLATSLSNDFTFTKATSGATTTLTVSNTSNTASSASAIVANVAGGTADDAVYQSTITAGQAWTWGLDNSDSDAFVLAGSATLGSTNVMRASTAGEVTMPLQPAFSAYLATQDLNITGDGTNFKYGSVTALTENFDQNGDFNTNGTFTAPVTGKYFLNGCSYIGGVLSTHTLGYCQIVTSNRNHTSNWCAPSKVFAVSTNMQLIGSCFVDMDAADTAEFQIQINNGTKVVDALAATNTQLENYFEGHLAC